MTSFPWFSRSWAVGGPRCQRTRSPRCYCCHLARQKHKSMTANYDQQCTGVWGRLDQLVNAVVAWRLRRLWSRRDPADNTLDIHSFSPLVSLPHLPEEALRADPDWTARKIDPAGLELDVQLRDRNLAEVIRTILSPSPPLSGLLYKMKNIMRRTMFVKYPPLILSHSLPSLSSSSDEGSTKRGRFN